MKKSIITEVCVALILLLFAYTATSKLIDYHKFVFQMSLVPIQGMRTFAPWLGWIVPILEAAIVLGLLFTKYKLPALYLALFLLIAFEVYIGTLLLSGLKLPCTCGGIISKMSWKTHLIFNAIFIVISIIPIMQYQKHKSMPQ